MTWETQIFQSGTTIVTLAEPFTSHYYIHLHKRLCDGSMDETAVARLRYDAAKGLQAWLNGEVPKHPWLNDAQRESDTLCNFDGRGVSISAVGPMCDPSGELRWVQLPEDDHMRKALIDKLLT